MCRDVLGLVTEKNLAILEANAGYSKSVTKSVLQVVHTDRSKSLWARGS